MTLTDPIANMLTSVRNAGKAHKETVDVPASKICETIVKMLKKEGYIENLRRIEDNKQGTLRIYLKYDQHEKFVISELKKISKPGLRVYVESDRIPRVLNGLGSAIISTSKGLLTDVQAREQKVGGEVLLFVW